MNWGRGLFRAWAGVTVLWLVGVAFFTYAEWPEPDTPAAKSDGYIYKKDGSVDWAETLLKGKQEVKKEPNVFDKFDPNPVRDHVVLAAQAATIPPIVLLALGWGCLWVGRGFRS